MKINKPISAKEYRKKAIRSISKYRNTKYHGFDSKGEFFRYRELQLLQKAEKISELKTQVAYVLLEKHPGQRAIKIVVDFQYVENGKVVVEDFKGFRTQVYLMKKKMFLVRYPEIEFRETRKDGRL